VRVAEDTGNLTLQPLVLCALGIAHLNAERSEDAVRACELAVRVAIEHSVWQFEEGSLFTFLSFAHLGAGDREPAARAAEDAIAASVRRKTPIFECGALVARSRSGSLTGSADARQAAGADLDRAVRIIDQTGAEAWRPFVHREYAELARIAGDEARFVAELRESLRLFDAMGARGHAAQARQELRR
jgi:hypothetical protein